MIPDLKLEPWIWKSVTQIYWFLENIFAGARTFFFFFFGWDFQDFFVWSWNVQIRAYSNIFGDLWSIRDPIGPKENISANPRIAAQFGSPAADPSAKKANAWVRIHWALCSETLRCTTHSSACCVCVQGHAAGRAVLQNHQWCSWSALVDLDHGPRRCWGVSWDVYSGV